MKNLGLDGTSGTRQRAKTFGSPDPETWRREQQRLLVCAVWRWAKQHGKPSLSLLEHTTFGGGGPTLDFLLQGLLLLGGIEANDHPSH